LRGGRANTKGLCFPSLPSDFFEWEKNNMKCKICKQEIEKDYEDNPNRRCKKCDVKAHLEDLKNETYTMSITKPLNSKGIFSRGNMGGI